MKKGTVATIARVLTCVMLITCLAGCGGGTEEVKIRREKGGTIDNSDKKAPKKIESKDITGFSCTIILGGDWGEEYLSTGGKEFNFCIKKNPAGDLTAYEEESGIEYPADDELLKGLQDLIDEYGLVYMNGTDKVTQALPPPYGEITFIADYASGEKLRFSVNNSPEADWEMAIYILFADWFSKNGIKDINTPERKVTRIDVTYKDTEDLINYRYFEIIDKDEEAPDGKGVFLAKYVYDVAAEKSIEKEHFRYPEDFFDNVTKIINDFDIRPWDRTSPLYGFNHPGSTSTKDQSDDIHIYLEYDDGYNISLYINDDENKELLKPLLDELFAYYDTIG